MWRDNDVPVEEIAYLRSMVAPMPYSMPLLLADLFTAARICRQQLDAASVDVVFRKL